jgi:hypothetical protein
MLGTLKAVPDERFGWLGKLWAAPGGGWGLGGWGTARNVHDCHSGSLKALWLGTLKAVPDERFGWLGTLKAVPDERFGWLGTL